MVEKYAAAVIMKGKVVKHLMNSKGGKVAKTVFFPESWYSQLTEVKFMGEPINNGKGMGPM